MRNHIHKIISLGLLSFLFFAIPALAQIPGVGESISITVSPKSPGPNEIVEVTANSFVFDINTADISWFVDGILVERGRGNTIFSFETGGLGNPSIIDIEAVPFGGHTVTKRIVIRPIDIDFIWSAPTYIPPFYKGKALHSSQSDVAIMAIPHFVRNGERIPANNLVYTWKKNGTVMERASGLGKNSVVVQGPNLLNQDIIGIEVASMDGSLFGSKSFVISSSPVQLLLYEDDPLLGMSYHRAIGNQFELIRNEATIVAYPYNFSVLDRNDEVLSYTWTIDGTKVETAENDRGRIAIGRGGEGAGRATIRLSVESPTHILQFAKRAVRVVFGVAENNFFSQ